MRCSAIRIPLLVFSAIDVILGCGSCVTPARVHKTKSIPVIFQTIFRACEPSDGEATLTLSDRGNRLFSAAMVWSVPSARKADVQFNSPVGDTIFQISRSSGDWSVTGVRSPEIHENSSGVISVNGYDVPLKSNEVGCVMAGNWPAEWLSSLEVVEKSPSAIQMRGADSVRSIVADIQVRQGTAGFKSTDIKSCVMLKWGGFLGFFENNAVICRDDTRDGVAMRMSGIDGFIAEWVIQHEQ